MSRVKVKGAKGVIIVLDQIRESIFDTIQLTAAGGANGTREFYSNIQNKQAWETNLNQGTFLEKNVSFKITSMALMAHTLTVANATFLAQFIEKTSVKLQIGDRDFWKGSARSMACGVYNEAALSSGVDHIYTQLGAPKKGGVVFGKDAHEIPSLFTFKIKLESLDIATTPDAGEDISLVCEMNGLRRRPVQ